MGLGVGNKIFFFKKNSVETQKCLWFFKFDSGFADKIKNKIKMILVLR